MFTDELTSYALNAALAMSEIIEFISDDRTDHLAEISTLARDSIDLYLSSLEPGVVSLPEEDTSIAGHPLMQQEQHQEQDDIEFLSGLADDFDDKVITSLKERASACAPLLPLMR